MSRIQPAVQPDDAGTEAAVRATREMRHDHFLPHRRRGPALAEASLCPLPPDRLARSPAKHKKAEALCLGRGVILVEDTGLEPVTSRMPF